MSGFLRALVLATATVLVADAKAWPGLKRPGPLAVNFIEPSPEGAPLGQGSDRNKTVNLDTSEALANLHPPHRHPHVCGKTWAMMIVILVFGGIFMILRSRILVFRILAIGYVSILCAISLTMRELSTPPLNYRFPGWVTVVHYFCTWVATAIYLCAIGEPEKLLPSSAGCSMRRYCFKMAPIAFSLPLSVAVSNKALVYIGAGLATIIATVTPVVTAVLSRLFGRQLAAISWLGVLVAFVGAFLAGLMEVETVLHRESQSTAHDRMNGVFFAVLAVLLRSLRCVVQDQCLSPGAYAGKARTAQEPEAPLGGMHLMAVQSPPVIVVAIAFAVITEDVSDALQQLTRPVVEMLVATIAIAILVNLGGMAVLKHFGSTSMQLIGKLNGIVTTAISLAFFGETLPVVVILGSLIILCGIVLFEMGETPAPPMTKNEKVDKDALHSSPADQK